MTHSAQGHGTPGRIKLGVRFPDYDMPIEPAVIRDFAQAVEELGYDHVTHFDHVVGMSDRTWPHWRAPYTNRDPWGEVLIMLTYMAACTSTLNFMPAVFVLPLRQTALAAKQVSTLDVLSGGRLRLGIGKGWNDIEFKMMGADFKNRQAVLDEQIELIRRYWTELLVTYRGSFHHVPAVGMNPLPVQQPIPIWLAPGLRPTEKSLKRTARLADGILPLWAPDEQAASHLEVIRKERESLELDPLGVEPNVDLGISESIAGLNHGVEILVRKTDEQLAAEIEGWVSLGATHLEFKTRECGLNSLDEQLREIERFKTIATQVIH